MRAVLGHEAAHEEHVPPGLETMARQLRPGRRRHRFRAVGDVGRLRPVAREVVLLHAARVGHDAVGASRRPSLGGADEPPREAPPLLPLPVETVDVQDDPLPGEPGDPAHQAIAHVEVERHVVAHEQRVDGRQEAVGDRVEVLLPDRRQLDEPHAAVVAAGVRDVRHAAIHGHRVPAGGEPRAELLRARLEAAVARGHAARAEQGDAKPRLVSRHAAHCYIEAAGAYRG